MDSDGNILGADGNILDSDDNIFGSDGYILNSDGNIFGADGYILNSDGNIFGADGTNKESYCSNAMFKGFLESMVTFSNIERA